MTLLREPPLRAHVPEFLWQPTRDELVTTRFMRNRVLFQTLAQDLLPMLRRRKGSPLKILFWACSTGCEPYTLRFMLAPDFGDSITGIDYDAAAIATANAATYLPESWTIFYQKKEYLLTEDERATWFTAAGDLADGALCVAPTYRRNISFQTGNLFAAEPAVAEGEYDLVVCNNLLLHLKPASADAAFDYLYRYVADDGALLVAGCNPEVRSAATQRLGLRPYPNNLREISQGWSGVSGAWNRTPRPAWAYPEPDPSDPDYNFKAGEIFLK